MAVPLRENVYRIIRGRLLNGQLTSGSQVSELVLSKELGVSRAPVREAISRLVGEGFVEQVPNAGSFVRTPDRTDLEDLYQLREWLEGEAAAEAARRIDESQVTQMYHACQTTRAIAREHRASGERFLRGSAVSRLMAAEVSFHGALIRACGNRQVLKLMINHHLMSQIWCSVQQRHDLRSMAWMYRGHARILRAVRRGDMEASRQAARAHVRRGRREMLAEYDWRQRQQAVGTMVEAGWPRSVREMMFDVEQRQAGGSDDVGEAG